MDQERIAYLFQKYYDKSADSSEREELMQFINTASDEEIAVLLERAFTAQDKVEDSFLSGKQDEILRSIFKAESERKRFWYNSGLLRYTAAAAVFLIVLIAGILTYRNITVHQPGSIAAGHQDIAPGGDKATITLADGSVLSLNDIKSGSVAEQSGIIITKTGDGQVRYELKTAAEESALHKPAYNTISTPRGGQFQVVLPDGTHVWLNSASSLRYPVYFDGKERRVELTGEGYFEVAKNKKMPFKVSTGNQVVTVLGTRFNINSYKEGASIKTTLLEGSVKINTTAENNTPAVFLSPGQQAQVNKDNDVQVVQVNPANATAWKNGLFQFEDTNIRDVMQEFSRWYDVDFEFEGDGSDINLKGRIYRNVNAVEALEILSYFNLKYRIVYSSGSKETIEKIIISRN